jgi:glycosyltransferase involved in cell wall biosynthesis
MMINAYFDNCSRIGIIGGGLAPYFNEAIANQMYLLSKNMNARVITCNDIGIIPLMKLDQYIIMNSKFMSRGIPLLSLINGVFIYLLVKLFERRFDIIIIPGGVESQFLNYLDLKKCIPIISSIPNDSYIVEDKIDQFKHELRGIIVQSKRTKNQLLQIGVDPRNLILIPPLVDFEKFHYSDPLPLGELRILFASSPNLELAGEDNFKDKGVILLLESFQELIKTDKKIKLFMIWRGKYNNRLRLLIERLDISKNVEVISGIVDMTEFYTNSHITVIPYLTLKRSPEIPLSALESLICGRPVVSTDVGEIGDLIRTNKCGCVSRPLKDDFVQAITKCLNNYDFYQSNTKYLREKLLQGCTD